MTDAEEDEILARASQQIMARLKPVLGRPLDEAAIDHIANVSEAARRRLWHRYGAKLPKLTIVCLPSVGHIHITRSDRTQDQIERLIVNLAREHPMISGRELALAIAAAFPEYRPRRPVAQQIMEANPDGPAITQSNP